MTNGPFQFQGIPTLNTPLVDSDGKMNPTWYRFFQSLYQTSIVSCPGMNVLGGDGTNSAELFYQAALTIEKEDVDIYALRVYYQTNGNVLGKILLGPI